MPEYKSYADWYDNGPGSEAFKRSCRSTALKKFPFECAEKPVVPPEYGNYPNIKAVLDGRTSGQHTEWPRLRAELNAFADELHYLRWFYENTSFGPAHEDVMELMKDQYKRETGRAIMKRYLEEEG